VVSTSQDKTPEERLPSTARMNFSSEFWIVSVNYPFCELGSHKPLFSELKAISNLNTMGYGPKVPEAQLGVCFLLAITSILD
jgi:hypothetical protein